MKFTTTAVQDIRLAQTCCADLSEARGYLHGIQMTWQEGKLQIVGSDGHRITKSDIEITGDTFEHPEIIRIDGYIPTATSEMKFDIDTTVDGGELCGRVLLYKSFSKEPFKILKLRLYIGTYPDWERVIGKNFSHSRSAVTFNPILLAEMAEAAGAKGNQCRLTFQKADFTAMKVDIYNYTTTDRPDRIVRLMPGRY